MPECHLEEYTEFYRKQPFGLWREDYRSAQMAHILALINRDPKSQAPELTDFMPFWKQSDEAGDTDSVTDSVLANRNAP